MYTLDFISNSPYHLDFYGITGLGGIGGLTDIYWERDTDRLFPRTIGDSVCIGINTRFSDELLRVYGSVFATKYRTGSDSIYLTYDVLGNLILSDTITGTKKLSELIPGDPVKILVDVATTANITLSGEQNIDGYATSNSRILVKDQLNHSNNGIYTTSSGSWSRSTDYSTWDELYKSYIAVINGTVNSGYIYICTIPVTGTIGVNAIIFSLFNGLPAVILDDILDWSTNKYIPYATSQPFLSFDTSSNPPYLTSRLNLNGELHATNLWAVNIEANNIVKVGVGFRINNTASLGAILRGDGTNFVSYTVGDLTKTDDTNVTLSLGGTPVASLINSVSLTLGWTGQLSLARGGTNANLTAVNGGIVYSTASAFAISAAGSTGQILKSAGEASPTWNAAAELSKTDDTNVTLSLGGSPTTALVNATSLTLGWTGQLSVARGGTGLASTTAYAVLCGGTTTTGALQSIASVGSAGQVFVSNGAGALPSFQNASNIMYWALQANGTIYNTNEDDSAYLGVGIGTGTNALRGIFDVLLAGDIYLSQNVQDSGTQTLYLPGHIYMAPYNTSNVAYLQARRGNSTGSTELQIRTYDAGTLVEGPRINSKGNMGLGDTSPTEAKLVVIGGNYYPGIYSTTNTGDCIYGATTDYTNAGVHGVDSSGEGVGVLGEGATGVVGSSTSGTGVSATGGIGLSVTALSTYSIYADGDAYFTDDVSALTYTDRTPYPKDLQTAYDSVLSMQCKEGTDQLDHDSLHRYIKKIKVISKSNNKKVENGEKVGRNLSATVSAQNMVIQDLIARVKKLEGV